MSRIPPLGAHPLDDVAVHAVDAGDPADGAERWVLEHHLARCPTCRAELDVLQDTVARLVRPVAPPPHLWSRITATLPLPLPVPLAATEAEVEAEVEVEVEVDARVLAGARSGGAGAGEPVALGPGRRRTRALLAAAAAVVVVAGAAAAVVAGAGGGTSAPGVAALAEAALADPGDARVTLTGPGGDPVARVVADDEAGGGFVLLDGLAPLPAGRAYQLWRVDGAAAVSLGVLGDGTVPVQAVPLPAGVRDLVITDEPAGGAIRPMGRPVAHGTFPPNEPSRSAP
jgi:anti-sigma-K factor RskA